MDIERIKEDLSICYLKTIAAVNGIALEHFHHDEDGIDVVAAKVVKISDEIEFYSQVSIQLKSTSSLSQYTIKNNAISYKLKVKNYNDLCMKSAMPSILVLLILPTESTDWLEWTEEELLLRGQMFWLGLQGNEKSNNSGTVSVKIPITNRLKRDNIESLLVKAAEEGEL